MPLRVEVPKGRAFWYLRGVIKVGKRSRCVYESTGVGAREPQGRRLAEQVRKRREPQLLVELHNDPIEQAASVSFTEAAASYGDSRRTRRLILNPATADHADKEMEYVAKWVVFFRDRGLSDLPLRDMCKNLTADLAAYFERLHIAKGNKLATMRREADVFHTVMNYAVDKGWADGNYPRCELPDFSALQQPVNKWLHDAEVRLFIRNAPPHLQAFVAGVFATGIRGGELIFCSRRRPDYADINGSGLSLEPGYEHVYLGRTKNGKPFLRYLPDWYVEMLHSYLEGRKDDHDALFLTDDGVPYVRPKRQRGFIMRTAWKQMRRRVVAVIERLVRLKAHQGDHKAVAYLQGRARTCASVTPHWGRHNVASHILRNGGSVKQAQRAGGWQSAKMMDRYVHLTAEAEKSLANEMDFGRANGVQSLRAKSK